MISGKYESLICLLTSSFLLDLYLYSTLVFLDVERELQIMGDTENTQNQNEQNSNTENTQSQNEPTNNTDSGKNIAIASMVLGIISVICWIFGVAAFISVITGIIGLVLSSNAKKQGFKGSFQTAGFVLSLIGLIGGLVIFVACIACAGCIGTMGILGSL